MSDDFGIREEPTLPAASQVPLVINDSGEYSEPATWNLPAALKRHVRLENDLAKCFIAEAFGCCIIVFFACGSAVQFLLMKYYSAGDNNLVSPYLAGALAATMAILFTAKISGAHLNPAVSLAMYLTGRMSLGKMLVYFLAQFLGALFGGLIISIEYLDALESLPPDQYAALMNGYGTMLNDHVGVGSGFFDGVVNTFILVAAVLALSDKKNAQVSPDVVPMVIAIVIFGIEASFGFTSGSALNPVRDFGPRVAAALSGWGWEAFTRGHHFFWIPLVAPMLGAFIAVIIYSLFVGNNLDDD